MTDRVMGAAVLRALETAAALRDALQHLHQLYGTDVIMSAGLGHIGIVIDDETGLPEARESLADAFAEASGTEIHPEVDDDLWITLSAEGQHQGTPVRVALTVPPATVEGAR